MKRPVSYFCVAYVFLTLMITIFFPQAPPDAGLVEKNPITIVGEVIQKEYQKDFQKQTLVITCRVISGSTSDQTIQLPKNRKMKCYLEMTNLRKEPEMGSFVQVSGIISLYRNAENPGEFDRRQYEHQMGVVCAIQSARILGKSEQYNLYREKLYQLKVACCHILTEVLPSKDAGIMQAMMFGNKSDLDQDIKALYQRSGISHMLAISGLHISLLGMTIYRVIRKMGCRLPVAVTVGLLVMISYGLLTGLSISTFRAIFMFTMQLIADLVGRTYDGITAISLAAAWIAKENPAYFLTAGVQFSFATVVGLFLLKPVMERFSSKYRWMQGSIMVLMVTFPLMSWHYYSYATYSMVLNLCMIPLLSVLMSLGYLVVVIGLFSLPLAKLGGRLIGVILWLYEWSAGHVMKMPGATWTIGRPRLWQIVCYYAVLLLLICFYEQFSNGMIVVWMMIAFCLVSIRSYPIDQMTFLSVGQGDGIVMLDQKGNCMTVDGGSTSKKKIGEYTLKPFLQFHGVDTISYAVITHLDEDHYNGIKELLEQPELGIRIEHIVLSKPMQELADTDTLSELIRLAQSRNTEVLWMSQGDQLLMGDYRCRCIWPGEGESLGDINAASVVLEVITPSWKGILTGDISSDEELQIMGYLSQTHYDFLKVAHHGSKYSSCDAWIEAVSPKLAIISAGQGNRYGHPHQETLERLDEAGIQTEITMEKGAIMISGNQFANSKRYATMIK